MEADRRVLEDYLWGEGNPVHFHGCWRKDSYNERTGQTHITTPKQGSLFGCLRYCWHPSSATCARFNPIAINMCLKIPQTWQGCCFGFPLKPTNRGISPFSQKRSTQCAPPPILSKKKERRNAPVWPQKLGATASLLSQVLGSFWVLCISLFLLGPFFDPLKVANC